VIKPSIASSSSGSFFFMERLKKNSRGYPFH
jgi:hypothetical protein